MKAGEAIFRALDKRQNMMIIKDNLLILHKNVCCDPSSEPSCQGGSDEGSQHMVSMRIRKIINQLLSNIHLI